MKEDEDETPIDITPYTKHIGWDRTWPARHRFWNFLHGLTASLMFRVGLEKGWTRDMYGCGNHLREKHWSVRLNTWVAEHYTLEWLGRSLRQQYEEDEPSAVCPECGFKTWFIKSDEMQHEHGCPLEFGETAAEAAEVEAS